MTIAVGALAALTISANITTPTAAKVRGSRYFGRSTSSARRPMTPSTSMDPVISPSAIAPNQSPPTERRMTPSIVGPTAEESPKFRKISAITPLPNSTKSRVWARLKSCAPALTTLEGSDFAALRKAIRRCTLPTSAMRASGGPTHETIKSPSGAPNRNALEYERNDSAAASRRLSSTATPSSVSRTGSPHSGQLDPWSVPRRL